MNSLELLIYDKVPNRILYGGWELIIINFRYLPAFDWFFLRRYGDGRFHV